MCIKLAGYRYFVGSGNLLYLLQKTIYIVCLLLLSLACWGNPQTDSLYMSAERHFLVGEYDLMLEEALEAMRLFDASGSCKEKGYGTMKVARAYYHLQQKQTALEYMLRAREMAIGCNDDSLRYKTARQAGAIYFEYAKYDTALIYLREAERVALAAGDTGELSSIYTTMGDVFFHGHRNNAKAIGFYDKAVRYALASGNKNSLAFAYMKQGEYAMERNNCAAAQVHFNAALKLYKEMGMVEGEMYALTHLGRVLAQCNRAVESFDAMNRLLALKDSIFKEKSAHALALYKTRYETEKKEGENKELTKNLKLKQLQVTNEVTRRRLVTGILVVGILGLLAVFGVTYSRYKLKKQVELDRELSRQEQLKYKAVIDAEENERERIAADLHDGVGQMMSAAKINLSNIEGEIPFATEAQRAIYQKVLALVDESCREVRAVSHSMMPNALLRSGLAGAMRAFVNQIDSRVIEISLYMEGLGERLEQEREIVLYRVIQECVHNVIKHAKAGRLDISLIKDDEGISATIEDNGVGFDARDKSKFDGIGLKNIIGRIAYLRGTVEWDSAPGKGTVVTVQIPDA